MSGTTNIFGIRRVFSIQFYQGNANLCVKKSPSSHTLVRFWGPVTVKPLIRIQKGERKVSVLHECLSVCIGFRLLVSLGRQELSVHHRVRGVCIIKVNNMERFNDSLWVMGGWWCTLGSVAHRTLSALTSEESVESSNEISSPTATFATRLGTLRLVIIFGEDLPSAFDKADVRGRLSDAYGNNRGGGGLGGGTFEPGSILTLSN